MSLLGYTARTLLLVACALSLVGSVGFYQLIHRKIQDDVDETLMREVRNTQYRLQHDPSATFSDWDDNPHIELAARPLPPTFSHLALPDSLNGNQLADVRQYEATVPARGRLYLIRYRQPYYEFNTLARHLSIGVIVVFLLLMALSVVVGLSFSRRLWRTFYATIHQLETFQLDAAASPLFPKSRVKEFSLLNRSLTELTQKLHLQYWQQKRFTENASHELQTPLAVATAQLDFLLQSSHLTEQDHQHLQQATTSINRLRQINRSLLLLTQVENSQFTDEKALDLSALVEQYLGELTPLFNHKRLTLKTSIEPHIQLTINRHLATVLVNNLLNNTLRHSPATGSVQVQLTATALRIHNSGRPLPFAHSQLFNRFIKDPARPDSTGLGLALVKQICDRYGLPLAYQYDYARGEHCFQVHFSKQATT